MVLASSLSVSSKPILKHRKAKVKQEAFLVKTTGDQDTGLSNPMASSVLQAFHVGNHFFNIANVSLRLLPDFPSLLQSLTEKSRYFGGFNLKNVISRISQVALRKTSYVFLTPFFTHNECAPIRRYCIAKVEGPFLTVV